MVNRSNIYIIINNRLYYLQKMSSDSEDENWHKTYPKNTHLLLTPVGRDGVLIPMTTETKLPFAYRSLRIFIFPNWI
jgi:hypothetical protein